MDPETYLAARAEGMAAAEAKMNRIRREGTPAWPGLAPRCPDCGLTATTHCEGCGACGVGRYDGEPHPSWCLGNICHRCRQPREAHQPFLSAPELAGRCPNSDGTYGPLGFEDLERRLAYKRWCNCTEEEAAGRRALGVAILQEFALGLGIFSEFPYPE